MQILACHAEVDHVGLSEVIIFCDKESLDYIKDHVGVTAQKIMSSQVFAIRDAKRAGGTLSFHHNNKNKRNTGRKL
jgi:hypothetical protein